MTFNSIAKNTIKENKNMLVPYYLMASYAYYKEDDPLFTDALFDDMSKQMLNEWDDIEHFHKHLINKDDLAAGSYLGEYPSIVEGAVNNFRKQHTKSRKRKAK